MPSCDLEEQEWDAILALIEKIEPNLSSRSPLVSAADKIEAMIDRTFPLLYGADDEET